MSYDPTLPVANSQISSAELREQLTGLKAMIDSRASMPITVNQLMTSIGDPPTIADVSAILDKLNELIDALKEAP